VGQLLSAAVVVIHHGLRLVLQVWGSTAIEVRMVQRGGLMIADSSNRASRSEAAAGHEGADQGSTLIADGGSDVYSVSGNESNQWGSHTAINPSLLLKDEGGRGHSSASSMAGTRAGLQRLLHL
jgi:hypothetical protein